MTEPAGFKMIPDQSELCAIRRELRFRPIVNRRPATLTPGQIAAFNREGYLSGIRIFSESEIAEHRSYFDLILAGVLARGGDGYLGWSAKGVVVSGADPDSHWANPARPTDD